MRVHTIFRYLEKHPWAIMIIAGILLIPALLINLGLNPVFLASDEAIRGLVSMEMILSGDYVVPTIQGEMYLKKPPLFNWILALFFNLFQSHNEFILRLPNIISIILFGLVIYFSFKSTFGKYKAATLSLIVLTTGRILFWDSFLGLIDITFSWLIFLDFMILYYYFKRGKFWHLFIISYAIITMAFLLKGMPALVFQGLSLLVVFLAFGKFKKLFSLQHLLGFLFMGLSLGIYYYIYDLRNPGHLSDILFMLFEQSARRTAIRFGFLAMFMHLFTFPAEVLYHFAPWTILAVFLFQRNLRKKINRDPFIKYMALIFIVNIIPYWSSPEVFPRYLFMFIPLLMGILFHLMQQTPHKIYRRIIHLFFLVMLSGSILATLAPVFMEYFSFVPHRTAKSLLIATLLMLVLALYLKLKPQRFAVVILALLLVRISFNWFILPDRHREIQPFKEQALKVAGITRGAPLYIYKRSLYQHGMSFYITAERGDILTVREEDFDPDAFYTVNPGYLNGREFINYLDYQIEWERRNLKLVKFTDR